MNKPAHILIKFPTRSRPEKFFAGLDNIINTAADLKNITIAVTADADDATMYNQQVLKRLKPYMEKADIKILFGTSKSKVDAVNRDMEHFKNWHIVVVYSDDMEFLVKGWDNIFRSKFDMLYPDFDGNLHFHDGFVDDRCCTMLIMGIKYYNRFTHEGKHYLYHPAYKSLYCDEEGTLIAKKLKRMAYFADKVIRHNHPVNVGGPRDAQLNFTESQGAEDRITFDARAKRNFDLTDQYINEAIA